MNALVSTFSLSSSIAALAVVLALASISQTHRVRRRLMGQRTALINQLRGLLAEHGLVLVQGANQVRSKLALAFAQEHPRRVATLVETAPAEGLSGFLDRR